MPIGPPRHAAPRVPAVNGGLLALTVNLIGQTPAPARPAFQFLRWKENWSVLPALPPQNRDALDHLKYVRLSGDGSSWASLGGDFRARAEDWQDFNFGA